jgi:hypothetical protein
MTLNPKIFIQIVSEDKQVQKLQNQIEKSFLLGIWVGKAIALLDRYLKTLNSLSNEEDPVQGGLKIEACEAYFMSSIIFFHRCFVDQPTMHLQIEQVTTDEVLRQTYSDILNLRNDEFIHWKGTRSNISVSYSFEVLSSTSVKFAEQLNGSFSDSIGPGLDVEPLRQLYLVTAKYIEDRRNVILDRLRSRISNHEAFLKCQF